MKTAILDMHFVSGALYVYVDFWNKDTMLFDTLLLTFDTGATVTTISKGILLELGYNILDGKSQDITTASGVEHVREVIIDKIRFGDFVLDDTTVYAHNFPEGAFTIGVIGLNVLSQFDINMLFSKKTIELAMPLDCFDKTVRGL